MAKSIQRLQIYELSNLFTQKDQLEADLAAVEHLEIQTMYLKQDGEYDPIHTQAAFYTTEPKMVAAVKAHISANIKAKLAEVEAEIEAIGSPVAKIEKALNMPALPPAEQQKEAA